MMIPDNYLLIGGAGAVAALALLIVWGLRKRKAVPTPAVSLVMPQKGVNPFDAIDYMTNKGMVQPQKEIHIDRTVPTDAFTGWLEEAIRNAANSSNLRLRVKIPDGATVDLFGQKGWKLEGEIDIGGKAVQEEEKEKPKPPEKPEDVT